MDFDWDFTYYIIYPLKSQKSQIREGVPCGAGRITCRITPTGKVTPCIQLFTEAGDVTKEPFHKIWWSSKELIKLRELLVSDLTCNTCELLPYCQVCIGQAALEDGNLTGCCKEAKRIAEKRKEVIRNA
ncbi:MAG: SPASM domain-containing protein [bacterium]